MNTDDRIKKVLSELFALTPDSVTSEFSMKTHTPWNSLMHLTVVLSLEDEFGVQFSDTESVALTGYHQIRETLQGKGVSAE